MGEAHHKPTGSAMSGQDNHGTHTAYNMGCRCEVCRKFISDYKRAKRIQRKGEKKQ